MLQEVIVNSRPDRELRKKIIKPGDYNLVPYEDSRCRITLSDVSCRNDAGSCPIEAESRVLSDSFDGNILIGDCDSFIDKDIELILQQMCCGEASEVSLVYRDGTGTLVKEIKCKIDLHEVTEEQLICDWGSMRLYEAALHHKEKGIDLVKEKRITDAFRRFNKALKMLIAMEPMDPKVIEEEQRKEIIDLKVKLLNNLAHCQLQYDQFEAAKELCDRALKYSPSNVKAYYRRCVAYTGLRMYEKAWEDIQEALKLDPSDVSAQQKANSLRPILDKMNKEYCNVIKKMFG